ncbi:hypothetical protein BJX99DRAFT_262271 [Aspergillus californicus]
MVFVAKILRTGLGFVSEAAHAISDNRSGRNSDNGAADTLSHPLSEHIPDESREREGTKRTSDVEINPDPLAGADQDEVAWQLDDMAEQLRETNDEHPPAPPYLEEDPEQEMEEEEKIKQREALARELVDMAGPPPAKDTLHRLPYPVIIPQRRPRKKDRGFVRAYAPVLDDCGLSQEVFVRFLEYLDTVNHASAWIELVFIAAQITSSIPFPAAMIVGTIVAVVAGTARELQMRTRANTFLEMVNRDLFMPRGLFALVIAFKPEDSTRQGPLGTVAGSAKKTLFKKEKVDLNQAAIKWSNPDPNRSSFGRRLDNIRVQSGETNSEIELPEVASLIYPDLDRVAADLCEEGQEKSQLQGVMEKFSGAGDWVNDYMDRRAMVFYEAKHPGTPLVAPPEHRTPMKSRFNDPDHPANSGSIIALVTGGLIPLPGPGKLLAKRNEVLGIDRLLGRHADPNDGRLIASTGKRFVKRTLLKDVLYLAIVNLPTEEEVAESRARLGDMEGSGDVGLGGQDSGVVEKDV